jgi:hypothetical protein
VASRCHCHHVGGLLGHPGARAVICARSRRSMDGRQQHDHHTAARRDRFYGNTTDAELSFVRGADDRVTALELRAGGSRRTGRRDALHGRREKRHRHRCRSCTCD